MGSSLFRALIFAVDILAAPFVAAAGLLLRPIRQLGFQRMPVSRHVLRKIGVLPVRDHYYEPLINPRHLRYPLDQIRPLPGVDLDEAGQLDFLEKLCFGLEWKKIVETATNQIGEFLPDNPAFGPGDADVWYGVIRLRKPQLIVEIGSGSSTLVARHAVKQNMADDPRYSCRHVCIEPYEAPWLESTGVTVFRERVEDVDRALFGELAAGDVLFIDSSHVIRPQGDVVTEYLEILPTLRSGVLVHVHDIFTPRDYPARWIDKSALLWNEQYLLEAFLTCNSSWRVKAALNYLYKTHFDALKSASPTLSRSSPEPGSFYLERVC